MTLCIAAACQYRNKPRIITCSDWKSSSADKLRWLKPPNWVALTAGDSAKAEGLIRTYRFGLAKTDITEENSLTLFSNIAIAHLKWMKNSFVQRKHGVAYDHFRQKGKREFPESVFLTTHMEVEKIDLGASLIVAGFVRHKTTMKPLICKIASDGDVSITDHFETIGEGLYVARPPLLRRQYNSNVSLMEAIYRVYEAKTLAEIVPSVGEDTSIDILYPDGTLEQVSSKVGYDLMDRMWNKYGPKKNIKKPKLSKKYFETLDFSALH